MLAKRIRIATSAVALAGALLGTAAIATSARASIPGDVVAAAATTDSRGGWTVTAHGAVTAVGTVARYGDASHIGISAPIVGIAATPSTHGYWLLGADGGIFNYGDAHFYGSTGHMRLQRPVVGMAATRTGRGYWLVASDGGIFTFGDAHFYGSTGGLRLKMPIVGMAATPSGDGYWLVAADGGIFTFGDAAFYGSTGRIHLNQPVRAMAATTTGAGYWMVAADGGVFTFGNAVYDGSTANSGIPVVGILPTAKGYVIAGADGSLRQMDASTRNNDGGLPNGVRACPSTYDSTVVALTNGQRGAHGLAGLAADARLMWAAQQRSVIQASNDSMTHDGWSTVIAQSGYPQTAQWGENIAAGFTSPQSVMNGWMGSTGHRENILNGIYHAMGAGCAISRTNTMYWTQDFG